MSIRFAALLLAGLVVATPCREAGAVSPLLQEFENAFVDLSDKLRPSVVEISAEPAQYAEALGEGEGPPSPDPNMLDQLFRFFGTPKEEGEQEGEPEAVPEVEPETAPSPPPGHQMFQPAATGSGLVLDDFGHIVTNNHVVADSGRLVVKLWDGTEHDAVIVGQDPDTDVAVLKIDPEGLNLTPARIGDSDELRVGQFAVAMGSPRGFTGTISFGHISGLGREDLELARDLRFQSFIQTDAAINLGNSGGPLCNIAGEVIGINIAIAFGANSIGFAIPINRVKEVVPELISHGKVTRGWLGVSIMDVSQAAMEDNQDPGDFVEAYGFPDTDGAFVRGVTWMGPAEEAELRVEDLIRRIDGEPVRNPQDLINQVSSKRPGDVVDVEIYREGNPKNLAVTLGAFPGGVAARYGRDFLGMHVMDITPELRNNVPNGESLSGVVIIGIVPDSPAARAEIAPYDIVQKIAHKDVTDRESFRALIQENAASGKALLFKVMQPIGEREPQSRIVNVPEGFTF